MIFRDPQILFSKVGRRIQSGLERNMGSLRW